MSESSAASTVGSLAVALARGHTEASLVVVLARFLSRLGEVEWVELQALDDGAPSRALRTTPASDAPTTRRPFALAPSSSATLLRTRADSKAPELRKAHQLGLRALVVLPLRSCDDARSESPGRVIVGLRNVPTTVLSDTTVLAALADVVSAALATCHVFARVGEVSRRAHVERRELQSAMALQREPPVFVARSRVMRRLLDAVVPQAARHDVSVLLLGESGVGKELLAAEIHRRSRRSGRVLLAINCAALPETLVDSALFGHEPGAFTGADRRHVGIFERAHRGTLFLDELGELSLATQARLLRVLDSGELERVGSAATIHVDVRVVAATNRDLAGMVRAGAFRLDLFHRLAMVQIDVPPLRERPEDIDALVPVILQKLARRSRVPVILPTPQQMRRLRTHAWPGNVRELENVLARALLLAEGGKLALDPSLGALVDLRARDGAPLSFADASRRCIEDALVASNGKIHGPGGAAALLQLKPTTLKSKMKKLAVVARRPT
jgi:formate hydrogenlyase transcriptional activator